MLTGMIKNREVLGHPVAICQAFGIPFYLRCLYYALVTPRTHSFLELLQLGQKQDL